MNGSDDDNTNLTGAIIAILPPGYNGGEDVLDFANTANISVASNTGPVLTLTGTATIAEYVAALESVTYENTSDDPDLTQRVVSFEVSDGLASSTAITRNINITPVNDKPVITGTVTPLAYTEAEGQKVIDSGIGISDVDDTDMESATVQVTGNYQNGEDVLAFVDQLGITGNFDAGTGTLTLTGTASIANYETALSAVTYENTSNNPDPGDRTVSFVCERRR